MGFLSTFIPGNKILDNLSRKCGIILDMTQLTVGEFKAKFSEVVQKLLQGQEVVVSYGKKKEKIGVFVPYKNYEKKTKRKLGIWEGKASVSFAKDFKMTVDEFLNS